MRLKSYLFTTLLLVFLSQSILAQKNYIDQPYIEVSGQVETEVVPNEIYLKIVLNEKDKRGKVSIETQEMQMLSTLKTLNIDIEKQLSVKDFDGFYQRKFLAEDKMTKLKIYQLIVGNSEELSEVYKKLDEIDISNISISKVSHTEIEKLKRETKIKALKVAKEKATQYANAIDQEIGKAILIEELNTNSQYASNLVHSNQASFYRESTVVTAQGIKKSTPKLQTIKLKEKVLVKFILK